MVFIWLILGNSMSRGGEGSLPWLLLANPPVRGFTPPSPASVFLVILVYLIFGQERGGGGVYLDQGCESTCRRLLQVLPLPPQPQYSPVLDTLPTIFNATLFGGSILLFPQKAASLSECYAISRKRNFMGVFVL